MEQPQEFVKESDGGKLVYWHNKLLYGLKQAANNCYKDMLTQPGVHQN